MKTNKPAAAKTAAPLSETALLARIQKNPRDFEAFYQLGVTYVHTNRLQAAIQCLEQAARLRPSSGLLNDLGVAYRKFGVFGSAMKSFEEAVRLDPANGKAHFNLAGAFLGLGKTQEAIKHYRLTVTCIPEWAERADASIAIAYEREGDYSQAMAQIQPYLDAGTSHFSIGNALSFLALNSPSHKEQISPAIKMLENALDSGQIEAHDRPYFLYRIGLLYQKKKDFTTAFEAFRRAHDVNIRFNEEGHAHLLAGIRSSFLSPQATQATTTRRHFFIVGLPRSGSTLIDQILSMSNDLHSVGEDDFFHQSVFEAASPKTIEDLFLPLPETVLSRIRSAYLQRSFRDNRPTRLVLDKNLENYLHIGQILQVFPDAKIIWSLRDPRDACTSIYTYDFSGQFAWRHDLGQMARHANSLDSLMRYWMDRYPKNVYAACYEKLVRDPESEIRKLITFCGLDWDDRYLRPHESDRIQATVSYNQVTQPIYTSAIGRWKNYEKHLAPLLEELEIPEEYRMES